MPDGCERSPLLLPRLDTLDADANAEHDRVPGIIINGLVRINLGKGVLQIHAGRPGKVVGRSNTNLSYRLIQRFNRRAYVTVGSSCV